MRALWIALLVAGCAKDLTKDFESLAERACACADKACGTQVLDELAVVVKNAKKSTADEKKSAEAVKRLGECLLRVGVTGTEIVDKINSLSATPPADKPAE